MIPASPEALVVPGPICIPWDPEGNLVRAYNQVVETWNDSATHIGLMDHDVEIISRNWHEKLKKALQDHPRAALVSCRINLQHNHQRTQSLSIRDDLNAAGRLEVAQRLAKERPWGVSVIGASPPELISGAWFFVHCERYLEYVKPNLPAAAFYGLDNLIHSLLHNAGFETLILEDVLVWHRYTNLEKRTDDRSSLPRAPRIPVKR